MFNLTVDEAHTFYVGQDGWLVHNADCSFWADKLGKAEEVLLDRSGHLLAAQKEIKGTVVARKADGKLFDHVDDVMNKQNSARNLIIDLTGQLKSGKLSPQQAAEAKALISRASRALDYSERYVPPGSKAGWKP